MMFEKLSVYVKDPGKTGNNCIWYVYGLSSTIKSVL